MAAALVESAKRSAWNSRLKGAVTVGRTAGTRCGAFERDTRGHFSRKRTRFRSFMANCFPFPETQLRFNAPGARGK